MHRCIPNPVLAWLLTGLLLSACSSVIPPLIREAPADNPSLEAVRANTGNYLGRQVRWGGKLIAVENRVDATWLTVLERPLRSDGEPEETDTGGGRFIAVVPAFLDPGVYAADRLVTITGILARTEIRKVGEFPYHYPVVQAQDWYLWPVEYDGYPYRGGYYDPWYGPWWYNPWYDPWWYRPWYGTRYYRHWYQYGDYDRHAHHHQSWKPAGDCASASSGCGRWHADRRPPRVRPAAHTTRRSGWSYSRHRADRTAEPRGSGGWRINRVNP